MLPEVIEQVAVFADPGLKPQSFVFFKVNDLPR